MAPASAPAFLNSKGMPEHDINNMGVLCYGTPRSPRAPKDSPPEWRFYQNPFYTAPAAPAMQDSREIFQIQQEDDDSDLELCCHNMLDDHQALTKVDIVGLDDHQALIGTDIEVGELESSSSALSHQIEVEETPVASAHLAARVGSCRSTAKSSKVLKNSTSNSLVLSKQRSQRIPVCPLVESLQRELNMTCARVQNLEKTQRSIDIEKKTLLSRIETKDGLHERQLQQKITSSVKSMKTKIKEERKSRQQFEAANKKLEQELQETNAAISKTKKDVEKERQSRELIQDVCDELAKEAGEDKVHVEEFRRETMQLRKVSDEERKSLQMGEVWREERVQVRLTEARFELQRKCVAIDKLKCQIEEFLRKKSVTRQTVQLEEKKAIAVEENSFYVRSTRILDDRLIRSLPSLKTGFVSPHLRTRIGSRIQEQRSSTLQIKGKGNKQTARRYEEQKFQANHAWTQ